MDHAFAFFLLLPALVAALAGAAAAGATAAGAAAVGAGA